MYRIFWKRFFDLVLSGLAIVILSPLFLILCLWVRLDSKGPVLFRQKRIGRHRKTFEIMKFRTMRIDTPHDVPTHLLKDPEQWITRAGRILRKTSLDELPQLLQIFTGKMAIVGPRPALWNQDDLVAEREKYGANDVRPGLTGWAQVNGRDVLSIEDKAALDGYYAARVTLPMDVKCIWKTVVAVLTRKGFQEGEHANEHRTEDE